MNPEMSQHFHARSDTSNRFWNTRDQKNNFTENPSFPIFKVIGYCSDFIAQERLSILSTDKHL